VPGRLLLRLLRSFEVLGGLPTRYLTGYYVVFGAEKAQGSVKSVGN
jgi:hypothetical protein